MEKSIFLRTEIPKQEKKKRLKTKTEDSSDIEMAKENKRKCLTKKGNYLKNR